jgi:RNA polymerase sigma-70 factor (ECF subfamily)
MREIPQRLLPMAPAEAEVDAAHPPLAAESTSAGASPAAPLAAESAEDPYAEDRALARALRGGDEAAFTALVDCHFDAMLRLATVYIADRAIAEEVVQDAWVRVLRGIGAYEGRASLKTWIFRILVNCARTRAQRESRSVPFSALSTGERESDDAALDADHFLAEETEPYVGGASPPRAWDNVPEERLLSRETRVRLEGAIAHLPERQRMVITLRDIEGWSAAEVCNFLGLSESNQRVLLHRARLAVRKALERYFEEE